MVRDKAPDRPSFTPGSCLYNAYRDMDFVEIETVYLSARLGYTKKFNVAR